MFCIDKLKQIESSFWGSALSYVCLLMLGININYECN